jgi:single-strand DNA-binding protein
VNKAIVVGRLGGDPETGETSGNMRWMRFSVATDERWKDKATGEKRSKTTWHRVSVWGNDRCNSLLKMLKKGSMVFVDGQMHHDTYTDKKSGAEQRSFEIRVKGFGHSVQVLDRAPGASVPDNVQDPGGTYDEADDYDRAAA